MKIDYATRCNIEARSVVLSVAELLRLEACCDNGFSEDILRHVDRLVALAKKIEKAIEKESKS